MLATNVGGEVPGGNQGNPTGGTSLSMATNPPLLPYMVSLSLPSFIQLINQPSSG